MKTIFSMDPACRGATSKPVQITFNVITLHFVLDMYLPN